MFLEPKYTHQLGAIKLNGVCLDYLLPMSPVACAAVTSMWGGMGTYCKHSGVYYCSVTAPIAASVFPFRTRRGVLWFQVVQRLDLNEILTDTIPECD